MERLKVAAERTRKTRNDAENSTIFAAIEAKVHRVNIRATFLDR